MTDERHRHRERSEIAGMDPDRLRYFTQPVDGRRSTRHRRRRGPEDLAASSTTGPLPELDRRTGAPGNTDRTSSVADSVRTDDDAVPAGEPPTEVIASPALMRDRARRPSRQPVPPSQSPTASSTRARDRRATPRRIGAPVDDLDTDRTSVDQTSTDQTSTERTIGDQSSAQWDTDTGRVATTADVASSSDVAGSSDEVGEAAAAVSGVAGHHPGVTPHRDGDSEPREWADHPDRRPAGVRRRRRRRIGMAIAAIVAVVVVVAVGLVGASKAGLLDSRKDFTNAAGVSDVLVHIPGDSTLKQIGTILVDDNVVGSVRAFVNAAGDASLPGGYYKLRTEIPAATAVSMISNSDSAHRVGRIVIPPGLPLLTKKDSSGRVTPGIFEMIASQTGVDINGDRLGVTVPQLDQAASSGTLAQLGIPQWAHAAVSALNGDSRRIEGLIAPGTWEDINPNQSATEILNSLIAASAQKYQQWGLVSNNSSGLSPYQTLVAASLLQGEVRRDDYAKVARVILNRLAKGQKLEFDSTANYTANIVDLNVHDNDLKADTPWNTYMRQGLPPTPIGAVEESALEAMEQPSQGNWLYFVTVDSSGTTLFTDDFNQHRRNIATACANQFIACR